MGSVPAGRVGKHRVMISAQTHNHLRYLFIGLLLLRVVLWKYLWLRAREAALIMLDYGHLSTSLDGPINVLILFVFVSRLLAALTDAWCILVATSRCWTGGEDALLGGNWRGV
ncbi:hypothetical protein Tter_2062 [Thermobaculum terrenum ATCC BAA-798]|uniref:Uncharacterized protein n=1 Tax=Thermobaculum terrenum (strain ATCC BAA-798 / CCMEE 7001 / YNP1) TaxID=525904 RepID=D1CGU4_THET1|nr:hypothetical protein Tter_2062 [Thermobaculum terrenum ATCC BAA-798]